MNQDVDNNGKVDIAAGCRGISAYRVVTLPNGRKRMQHFIDPVPEEFLDLYVPWPWQERLLPIGAYTSIWPDAKGNDWSKAKPENFGPDWRPAPR